MLDLFLRPKRPLGSQSRPLVRQVRWSRRESVITPVQQRGASEADPASAEIRFQGQKVITLGLAEQFRPWRGNVTQVFLVNEISSGFKELYLTQAKLLRY
jgi:hypothetical protein